MKLIKFNCVGGGTVYINPEQVSSIDPCGYSCTVRTSNGRDYFICDEANKVVKILTDYIPKTHY